MSSKTVAFKQPTSPTRTHDDWVGTRALPQAESAPTKRLTVDVTADLHKRLKMHCASSDRQISDVVRELLEREFPNT